MSDRFGATVVDGGTRFEVWAPGAEQVDIVLDASGAVIALSSDESAALPGSTTWGGVATDVGHGDRYRVRLDGDVLLPDPASRWQPEGVHGPSAVVDPATFDWSDDSWSGVAIDDAIIYELHVGTFTPEGTFGAAIGQLPRLVDLGVTVIEIMPVNAFPGERNWGYDGVFPSAVQASYGGPHGLAQLVDAAHRHGLAVLLDVVYNHLGPEGNVLPQFGPYFTDAFDTPWGAAVNVSDRQSDAVRRFFIESAVGFVDDFHLDGLRVDAVHAIVDPTAQPMVSELVAAVHDAGERDGRTVLVTLESAANDPRMVRPVEQHGWGADAVWNDDVHHALRVALTGERHEYYAGYVGVDDLAAALDHRWVYRGQYSPVVQRRHGASADDIDHRRFIAFSTNHDHVGNTPRGERLLHDSPIDDPRRRLAAAFVLLAPFTPLLFMGEEYGEPAPFPYFIDHGDDGLVEAVRTGRQAEFAGADWAGGIADPADPATYASAVLDPSVATDDAHGQLLAMYTELIRLRRSHGVLTDPASDLEVTVDGGLLTATRRLSGRTATLRFNFSDDDLAAGARGDLVFDSSAPAWGGNGSGSWSARLWIDHSGSNEAHETT